jgi:hypothetical protein
MVPGAEHEGAAAKGGIGDCGGDVPSYVRTGSGRRGEPQRQGVVEHLKLVDAQEEVQDEQDGSTAPWTVMV